MSVCVTCPKKSKSKGCKVVINRSNCWPPMNCRPCAPCPVVCGPVKCVPCPTTTLMYCSKVQGGFVCTAVKSVPCAPPACCPVVPYYCYPTCYNC